MDQAPATAAPVTAPITPPPAPAQETKSVAERAKEFLSAIEPDPKPAETPKTPETPSTEPVVKEPEGENDPSKDAPADESKPNEFAKKFAAITRKERTVYERDKAVKAREAKVEKIEKLLETAKVDPEAYLAAAGVSLADVAQYVMRRDKTPSDAPTREPQAGDEVKKVLAEVKAEREALAAEKAQITQREAIGGLEKFVKSDSEKYPVCGEFIGEAIPFALDIAWQYRQTYGKDPEVHEVFDKVESVLREKKTAELQNLKKISLFSDYFKASEAPKVNGSNGQATSTPTKTLTNAPVISNPEAGTKGFRSEDERIRYFASMIKDR